MVVAVDVEARRLADGQRAPQIGVVGAARRPAPPRSTATGVEGASRKWNALSASSASAATRTTPRIAPGVSVIGANTADADACGATDSVAVSTTRPFSSSDSATPLGRLAAAIGHARRDGDALLALEARCA